MIGARAKETSTGFRIREARSQAFTLTDQHGELHEKHYPPSLDDEIWRLEKIRKDGGFHIRLASHRISTVKDFLQMYVTNQSLLLKMLGNLSLRTWKKMIKHAETCVLDDKLYMYTCAEKEIGLLINSVLKVVGAACTFDGQSFLHLDKLSVFQMPVVEASKQQLYKQLELTLPVDEQSVFGDPVQMSNLHHDDLKSASLGQPDVNIPVPHQDFTDQLESESQPSFQQQNQHSMRQQQLQRSSAMMLASNPLSHLNAMEQNLNMQQLGDMLKKASPLQLQILQQQQPQMQRKMMMGLGNVGMAGSAGNNMVMLSSVISRQLRSGMITPEQAARCFTANIMCFERKEKNIAGLAHPLSCSPVPHRCKMLPTRCCRPSLVPVLSS